MAKLFGNLGMWIVVALLFFYLIGGLSIIENNPGLLIFGVVALVVLKWLGK